MRAVVWNTHSCAYPIALTPTLSRAAVEGAIELLYELMNKRLLIPLVFLILARSRLEIVPVGSGGREQSLVM